MQDGDGVGRRSEIGISEYADTLLDDLFEVRDRTRAKLGTVLKDVIFKACYVKQEITHVKDNNVDKAGAVARRSRTDLITNGTALVKAYSSPEASVLVMVFNA